MKCGEFKLTKLNLLSET